MERQLVEGVVVGDVAVRNSTTPKQEGREFTDRNLWRGWGEGAFSNMRFSLGHIRYTLGYSFHVPSPRVGSN